MQGEEAGILDVSENIPQDVTVEEPQISEIDQITNNVASEIERLEKSIVFINDRVSDAVQKIEEIELLPLQQTQVSTEQIIKYQVIPAHSMAISNVKAKSEKNISKLGVGIVSILALGAMACITLVTNSLNFELGFQSGPVSYIKKVVERVQVLSAVNEKDSIVSDNKDIVVNVTNVQNPVVKESTGKILGLNTAVSYVKEVQVPISEEYLRSYMDRYVKILFDNKTLPSPFEKKTESTNVTQNIQTLSSVNPPQTLSNNLAPVYVPVGIVPPNPQNNSNGALLFSATNISGENFITNTLKISGITGSTQCLQVDTNGSVNGTGSTCGAGGGGSSIGGVVTGATAGSVLFAGVGGVLAQDNTNIFWDDTMNRLGIGTNSPVNKLSVSGTANVSGHVAVGSSSLVDYYTGGSATFPTILHVSETMTSLDPVYGAAGISNEVTFNPSSGNNLYGYGMSSEARTQAGNATNYSELYGNYNFVGHYGSGNVTNIYADLSKAYNYQTAGSVGSMYAYYAYPYTDSRPVTNMYSFYGWPGYSGGGVVTNGYGVYIDNSFGSPITNSYGTYIAGQTVATNNVGVLIGETGSGTKNTNLLIGTTTIPTGSYSIYNSSTDNNYFAGNLGLGDISPVSLLTVGNGDLFQVNSSGAIAAAAGITSSGTITFSGLGGGGTQCVQVSNIGVMSGSGGACGGSSTTLTQSYDADANGSDATIALTTADDSIIISNPSSAGTDSTFALKVDQLASGNVAGVVISQAGTGNLLTADSSNSSGNGASIDVQSSSSSQYAFSVTSNNGATTGLLVRADGNVGIGTNAPGAYLDVLNSNPAVNDSIYWRTAGQISGILSNSGGTGAGTMILKDGSGVSTARIDGKTGNANYINNAGNFGLGTTSPSAVLDIDSVDAASIASEKIQLRIQNTAQTLTDGTTIANWRSAQFLTPTINGVAGGGTETVTNAATVYVDGAPSGSNITITNPYALWVDAGTTRLDGNLQTNVTGSTQCLQADTNGLVTGTGSACGGSSTTLTQSYDADANGSDATIALTSADDSVIIFNPSSSGTDSTFAFKVDQLATGAVDGFVLNNAGTGTLLTADNSNSSGNGVSVDVQSSSSSQYAFKATSNNGSTTGIYVRADGNVGIGSSSPSAPLYVSSQSATTTGGLYTDVVNSGSGSLGTIQGSQTIASLTNNSAKTIDDLVVQRAFSSISGDNTTITNWKGVYSNLNPASNTLNFAITNMIGVDVLFSSATGNTGTITNAYGIQVSNTMTAPVPTNGVGVMVNAQTVATNNVGITIGEATGTKNTNLLIGTTTQPTGSYSIYNSSSDQNYFAGSLGIGATSPQALLEVAGADTADATLALSADRSDDTGDTWFIKSLASGNALSVLSEATEVLNLTTAGALQIDSNLTVSGLGGGGTKCVHVDNSGVLSTTGSDCGSGGASSLDSITAAVADDTNNDNTDKQIAWDWSTPTTQTAFKLQNTGTGLTSGSIFNVSSATTSTVATNGIVSLNATGNYASTSNVGLLQVAANATTAGTVAKFSGTALTSGTGVAVIGGTAMTTGSLLQLLSTTYNHGNATETGNLVNIAFTDATNGTATSTTNGINIAPTINVTTGASGTKTINGAKVSAPTLTACTGGSSCIYTGLNVDTTGTLANTTIYSALFSGGNVGIGDATPASLFTVGTSDAFQINSSGVVSAGTWNGTAITDTYVADAITISSSGTVDWTALSNYPSACGVGTAVSTLADSPTCTAFNTDTSITLQDAYNVTSGNTITTSDNRDIAFTLADVSTPTSFTIQNMDTAGASAQRIFSSIGTGTLTNGLLIEQTGGGTMTNAIQITETTGDITDGIKITGTLGNILNSPTLDITGAGAITGAASVNGLVITANTGVVTTGTWNGTAIAAQYGGTGLNTSASTGVPSISSGTWSVNAQLPVSLGGTGAATFTANGVLYGNSASAVQVTAAGSTGECLIGNTGSAPTWGSCGSGASTLNSITAAGADDTNNDNTNFQIAWDWSNPTTQTAFKLQNTGTGLTSGSIFNVSSATTGAVATNGIVSLNATGNYTSTSNVGLLQVAANSTTAGTIAKFIGTSLTTGTGVALVGGTAMTTGSLLQLGTTTYNHGSATETGSLVNISFADSTNGTATSTTNGINITPTISVSTGASGTKTINGLKLTAPTLTSCTGGSTCVYTGVNVASAGTLANTTLYSALFNGGNVGIGTTAPAQLLTIASTSSSATIAMQMEDSAQSGSSSRAINWRSTAGTVFDYAKIRAEYGNSYINSRMIFSTGNTSSSLTDRMAIDQDGDVGIQGNLTPSYPLSFASSTGDKIALYGSTGYGLGIQSNLLQIYTNNSTDRVGIGYGTSASFTEVLTTKTSFVGIGNTSPDSRLDISGNITGPMWGLNGILIQGSAATYTDSNTVISGTATNSAIVSFGQPTINATNATVTTTNAYGMYVAGAPISGTNQTLTNTYGIRVASTATTDGAGGTPTNSYGLYVDAPTGATNNYAAIFEGGNLGVGTTVPTAQLMVTTSDAAKVAIIAKRIAFQTADIQQWQDENGTVGLAVDPIGVLYAGSRSGSNLAGFNTYISGGYGTGNGTPSSIEFQTPDTTTPGATLQVPSTKMILYNSNLGIGTTTPSTILALGSGADRTIQVERRTTNNIGNNLTVQAGGAKSASTNFGGGDLILASGIATGNSTSNIQFQVPTNSGGSGTADRAPATVMTILGGGNVGIGSTTPGANLDIVTAATTGIGERITASSLTSGTALSLVGPTSSGVTGLGSTAGFLNVTSDVGTGAGTAGVLAQFNADYNGGAPSYGVRVVGTDATTNTNTLYNMFSSLDITNNGTKTGISTYGVAVTSSTTANSLTGGFFVADSTGAVTSGTQTMIGVSGSTTVNGANTSTNTTNMYGGKFTTNMYNSTTATVNSYGLHASASSILSGAGVTNIYGAYIDDGSADGTGTSTKYGLFVKTQTGADNNYAAIFEGGTVGIGTSTPPTTKSLDVQGEVQINFPTTGATTIGVCKSQTDGTAANNDLVECSGTPGDLAEWYETNEGVEAGDVVSSTQNEFSFDEELFDPNTGKPMGKTKYRTTNILAKSTLAYSNTIFGVVSESPLQTLGDAVVKAGAKNAKPIALVGRVPVKISTENGSVAPGDYLTASSKFPGFAMKATRSGNVIGTAIGYFPPQNLRGQEDSNQIDPVSGEILVFVRPTYAVINNTFVLGSTDTTQLMNTENGGVRNAEENTFLINQKGNDTILQLQQNNIDRLLVQSNGSMQLLTSIKCEGIEKRNAVFTPRGRMSGDGCDDALTIKTNNEEAFTITAVGDVKFSGRILVGKDTAGIAKINAHANRTTIMFATPYPSAPVIIATPHTIPTFSYGVVDVTPNGFTIATNVPVESDTNFSWVVVYQPESTLSVSGAPVEAQAPIVNSSQVQPLVEVVGDSSEEDLATEPSNSTPNPDLTSTEIQ